MDLFDLLAFVTVPVAVVAVVFLVWRFNPARWLSRRATVLVAAAFLALGVTAFSYRFGDCDFRSKFCTMAVPDTRSEIGFEWDGWNLYWSTAGDEPTTYAYKVL